MDKRGTATVVAAALCAAIVGGGATWSMSGGDEAAAVRPPDPATAARTSFPGLAAASGEPWLDGLRQAHPRAGAVALVAGPFDDRFSWGRLRVRDGVLTGSLHITSDVSDLLELQVLAGFYDARGHYLGAGRFVHHMTEETRQAGLPAEVAHFTITAPAKVRDRVRSASAGVPVLVNE